MLEVIIIIFCILILVNLYLYISGLRLRKRLAAISRRIAEEEISYELKKLETSYILEAYDALKKSAFQEKYLQNFGINPHPRPVSVEEGYTIQRSFISFVNRSFREINRKYNAGIKLNVVDGEFNITFSESLTIIRILLLLAEKNIRKEISETSVFILAHGPVQFSIEARRLSSKRLNFYLLLQDHLMNFPSFNILDHHKNGHTERYVIGLAAGAGQAS